MCVWFYVRDHHNWFLENMILQNLFITNWTCFKLIKLPLNLWESDYFTYELWHNLIFHLLYKYAIHKFKSNFHLLYKPECAIHKLKSNRWDRFTITAWWFFSARFRFIYMLFLPQGEEEKRRKGGATEG